MRRAIQLAENSELTAHPNPMVGAVIVGPSGRILGEGYHHAAGEPHAEVNAIRSVRPEDLALLPQSTIYVTLEPCAHYGRTPPCAELLIRHHIGRVVVGCVDPFTKVGGRGIGMLREAGIEVTVGVLREECLYLIRHFICAQTMRRPFITLKWARSADGYIDRRRTSYDADGPAAHLSTPLTQIHVHHLRASHQAILVGRKTLELDRPSLSVRHYGGRSPLRCVLGGVGEEALNAGYQAYADIDSLLEGLRREGIQSLLVEGGAQTLQSFIERDLWDEAWEEHSDVPLRPKSPNGPTPGPSLRGRGVVTSHEEEFSETVVSTPLPHRGGSGVGLIPAPEMPHCFRPEREMHFGVEFYHWKSPVLQKHYVDF